MTTTAHYIDSNSFELKAKVLETVHTPGSHSGEKLAAYMKFIEETWGLKEVKGVSDNAANIQYLKTEALHANEKLHPD